MSGLLFADADSDLDDSSFAIFGVPFDGTCSFRKGAAKAPDAIREASYNFETYKFEHDLDLKSVKFCDLGNLVEFESAERMVEGVEEFARNVVSRGVFPIALGGEHSITPPIVKCLGDVGVIMLDAHLDFRKEYEGESRGHCSSSRIISSLIGVNKVVPIGVRSMSKEEKLDADRLGLRFISSYELLEVSSMEETVQRTLDWIGKDRIYLSLDMDVIDPAFSPGIGNPEPFGLSPMDIKRCINYLGGKLVGFDVCEVSPPYDNGNTSALAARLVREVILAVWKAHI